MTTTTSMKMTANDAAAIVSDAYVFGYPLVLMEMTRKVMTNVAAPTDAGKAPMNRLGHIRTFPDETVKDIASPNADTLYSAAWLDVEEEPMVLSVPNMEDRYYVLQMLDAWSNVFASPGKRTTGGGKHDIAIVGPDWQGTLAPGLEEVRAPTNVVLVALRIQTNGKEDYEAVNALQNRMRLVPLSRATSEPNSDRSPVDSKVDMRASPAEQVRRLSPREFFSRLNTLMKKNPPASADADALRRFAAVGVVPGRAFETRGMESAVALGVERGARAGIDRVSELSKSPLGKIENGWDVATNLGTYATNYKLRAAVARVGLGANLAEDALCPIARTDESGKPLHGSNKYVLRFATGQTPPVHAFWSLSVYGDEQTFAKNKIGRFSIGNRNLLVQAPDGSLTIYLQNDSPGPDKEQNWLPIPKAAFSVMLRLYSPEKKILEGAWRIPPIERAPK
ncbi:MAG: DUF1254 domain-containing protein [Polyangiaceae bacterium]|nr:DUF1254 domain-containing protein [Polyangiaceae bacterium]